ncbi:DUF4012 domain-containing protein [Hoyosella sp. G463]|uniref:DUF4012 domain-containing protein n=1 Tax=Lolliginicoccus lacisalsi TaxID=2742202 RepID=A0A927PLP4_9ACTN|nr:DUF4012 domain-containing protein [Lolliginicoccus lacisalsi]MBD8507365.1 DUF4012 domain-containing protein [Lolliginicoccus lacisalsi]
MSVEPEHPAGPARPVSRRRRFLLVTAVIVSMPLVWLGFMTLRAYFAIHEIEQRADAARVLLRDGEIDAATSEIRAIPAAAHRARAATTSVPWRAAATVPWAGAPFDTIRESTIIVDRIAATVVAPALDGGMLDILGGGGQPGQIIDVEALRAVDPVMTEIARETGAISDDAARIPAAPFPGQVNAARDQLVEQAALLATATAHAADALRVLPAFLGADEPRRYLVVFQTNAESRGTGGLMGGAGMLRIEDGGITFEDSVSNQELPLTAEPIDLGPGFDALYGRYQSTQNWQNANFSPHFPHAARIWRSIWAQHMGEDVDGVIATDPVALSHLLGVVGPVTLGDGETITKDNVVGITLNEAYFRFGDRQLARKAYLQEIAGAVMARVNAYDGPKGPLVRALATAIEEKRILAWSADPDEQAVLGSSIVGGTLPQEKSPYAHVVLNNGAGGKLDYYLERSLEYRAGPCTGDRRESHVTLRLTNTAPALDQYPDYLMGRLTPETQYAGPPGTNRTVISLFATPGARLANTYVNDRRVPLTFTNTLLGHPVFTVVVLTEPGETITVRYDLDEPARAGEATVPVQPLVDDPQVSVDVPDCGAAHAE